MLNWKLPLKEVKQMKLHLMWYQLINKFRFTDLFNSREIFKESMSIRPSLQILRIWKWSNNSVKEMTYNMRYLLNRLLLWELEDYFLLVLLLLLLHHLHHCLDTQLQFLFLLLSLLLLLHIYSEVQVIVGQPQ